MPKLQIVYDATDEIEKITKLIEDRIDMKNDEGQVFDIIQAMFQTSFNEGRKFQKQITCSTPTKDGLLQKSDI